MVSHTPAQKFYSPGTQLACEVSPARFYLLGALAVGYGVFLLATARGLSVEFGFILGVISAFVAIVATCAGVTSQFETIFFDSGNDVKAHPELLSGHTIILGRSAGLLTIISELEVGTEHEAQPVIVILCDEPEELCSLITKQLPKLRTKVLIRGGNRSEYEEIHQLSPDTARAIILVSEDVSDPDVEVLKTLHAIINAPTRKTSPYHIVAELREQRSMEAARLVGAEEVELVLAADLLARIALQTCRQPGLAVVYEELLDFAGDEIYFGAKPELAGALYGEAIHYFEQSSIIGVRKKDGSILLNPPTVYRLEVSDDLIAIARDSLSIKNGARSTPKIDEAAIHTVTRETAAPERTLILGWNLRVPSIIAELETYVAPGSQVLVVSSEATAESVLQAETHGLKHQTVSFREMDTTSYEELLSLDIASFHHVLVLAERERFLAQDADARTLSSLVHLRKIAKENGHTYSIVSELLRVENEPLAKTASAADTTVSGRLVSLLLSQISQTKDLSVVFAELFRAEGSEIYLRPANEYAKLDKPVNSHTALEAAKRKNETAIGYRPHRESENADLAFGVVVNPKKSDLIEFTLHDSIIVLAES